MNAVTGVVLYVLIWWIVLFAVLPVGTRPMEAADPQSGWRGTPQATQLWRKVIATTLIAGLVWLGAYLLISSDWISFRHGYFAAPED
jgi:predicted secreted protein